MCLLAVVGTASLPGLASADEAAAGSAAAAPPAVDPVVSATIDLLAEVDGPDYGTTPWASTAQFAPVPASRTIGSGILGSVGDVETPPALVRLVSWGPRAIPTLLARLTDETPTRYAVEHGGGFGAMWYGAELEIDPEVPAEAAAIAARPSIVAPGQAWADLDEGISRHVITVGDLCMLALGQIVNRDYAPTRYQPTACIVVRSPTRDAVLAEAVREIWGVDDPTVRLRASLQRDRRSGEEDRRSGALTRLLYWFPEEVAGEIVADLEALGAERARAAASDDPWALREWKRSAALMLDAVAFSAQPRVAAAVVRLAELAADESLLARAVTDATLAAHGDRLVALATRLVRRPSTSTAVPDFGRRNLLRAIAMHRPAVLSTLAATMAAHGTAPDAAAVAWALRDVPPPLPWAEEVLAPMLDDRRGTRSSWSAGGRTFTVRVCDMAATALAEHVPGLRIAFRHDVADLDRQIAAMRLQLAGEPAPADPLAPIALADVPAVEAMAGGTVERILSRVHDVLADGTLVGISSRPGGEPRARVVEVVEVGPRDADVRVRFELPPGRRTHVTPPLPGRIVTYDGEGTGEIVIRAIDDGRVLTRFDTPFHDGQEQDDPLQVQGFGDLAITPDGSTVVVVTSDGVLHAFPVATGERRIVTTLPANDFDRRDWSLHVVRRTSRVLLTGFGMDRPMMSFDAATGEVTPVAGPREFQSLAVRDAAGPYVLDRMNGRFTVWDLEAAGGPDVVPLRLEPGTAIGHSIFDPERRLVHAIVAGPETAVLTIDLRDGRPVAKLPIEDEHPGNGRLALSADGSRLVWHRDRSDRDERWRVVVARSEYRVVAVDEPR